MTCPPPGRFVVLRHEGPNPHWDWLFETGPTLRTFKSTALPDLAGAPFEAVELPPHRRLYLEYEGPVGKGRGWVAQLDAGYFLGNAAANSTIELDLRGRHFRGRLRLRQLDDAKWEGHWTPNGAGDDAGR